MEWKVRALDDDGNPIEPKQKEQPEVQEEPKEVDTQEVKEEITDNNKEDGLFEQKEVVSEQAEEQAQDVQEEKKEVEQKVEKPYELDDNSILSYLKDRHN